MKAFKCDKCGNLFEGAPANRGHQEQLSDDNEAGIYSIDVQARVLLTKHSFPVGQDLCDQCFINALAYFISAYQHRVRKASGLPAAE